MSIKLIFLAVHCSLKSSQKDLKSSLESSLTNFCIIFLCARVIEYLSLFLFSLISGSEIKSSLRCKQIPCFDYIRCDEWYLLCPLIHHAGDERHSDPKCAGGGNIIVAQLTATFLFLFSTFFMEPKHKEIKSTD